MQPEESSFSTVLVTERRNFRGKLKAAIPWLGIAIFHANAWNRFCAKTHTGVFVTKSLSELTQADTKQELPSATKGNNNWRLQGGSGDQTGLKSLQKALDSATASLDRNYHKIPVTRGSSLRPRNHYVRDCMKTC